MAVRLWPGNKAAVFAMEDAILSVTEKSTPSSQPIKSMLIIFFDIRGIVHKEFVPPGQTVNGKFYCEVLRQLRENMRHKRPEIRKNGDWLLHHDNAPAHTSLIVREFLTKNNMTTVSHPAYSPHLAPPTISACSLKWNSGWKGGISYPLKRSKQNRNRY